MGAGRRLEAAWVWTGETLLRDAAVMLDATGRVTAVEPAPGAPPGLLMPGLVNAHTHLELSDLRGAVPGGDGLFAWVTALLRRRREPDPAAMLAAAFEAREAGVAAVVDVGNTGASLPALAEAGLGGALLVEAIGLAPERWRVAFDTAACLRPPPGLRVGVTAHAPHSCAPELLRRALRGGPATVHCDEDPDEARVLGERAGPWAEFLALREPEWDARLGRAPSGTALLDDLGLLGPHLGLVHMVAAREADLDRAAAAGAGVVLCPRSNLFIGRALPPVPAMVERGIPLAIGTDSLASAPDLDPLAEAVVLARAFPRVPREVWARALTVNGARLAGDPKLGRLEVGRRPGVLHVAIPPTEDPLGALFSGEPLPRTPVFPGDSR